MYRVLGIGNLVCDIYYYNGKIIGINGGKTFSNIIFNLANMNVKTRIIGNCGNDVYGQVAIDSLNKSGVNTENIIIHHSNTNVFNIDIKNNSYTTNKKCPLCNSKKWTDYSIHNIVFNHNEIVIIDSLKYIHLLNGKIVMFDIGYYNELEKMSNNELKKFLTFQFEIINMNQRVAAYLTKRLNLKNEKELFSYFNASLLIITQGKKGANYYSRNCTLKMKLNDISNEVDPNGAGDLFFASTIKDYINNNLMCDEHFIEESFKHASLLTKEIVKVIGARTYYQKLYQVTKVKSKCYCETIKLND